MPLSRADRSLLAEWWFTVDRTLLAALLALIATGLLLSLAASPSVAVRRGFEAYHFVERHALFAVVGTALMLGLSLLKAVEVRRLSLLLFGGAIVLMTVALWTGPEINGARRWVLLAGQQLQPSEILKPALVVISAWALSGRAANVGLPGLPLAALFLVLPVALLVLEPDVGQALLLVAVWGGLLFLSGQPLPRVGLLAAAGAGLMVTAYLAFDHVRSRFDRFLDPAAGDTFQMDRARESFTTGGWFGRGPGEGRIKIVLPDAHTDFIAAVIAEEYGVIACLALLALYGVIVVRAVRHAVGEPEQLVRLAVLGLASLVALQALVNIGVNAGLLPAKGLTLPFISYGGSALIGMSIGMGFLLALTRRRPGTGRPKSAIMLGGEGGTRLTR